MAFWDKSALEVLSTKETVHLINSVTGIKPGNLISTCNDSGQSNLAVFSSVVHLGSKPPLLSFVLRPSDGFDRHTYENIKQTGRYNINAIHQDWLDKAHMTSVKFARDVSEFNEVGLIEEYKSDWAVPFVEGAPIQLGLVFREEIDIKLNKTKLIIGEIDRVYIHDHGVAEDGRLDLSVLNMTGIAGLNGYYKLDRKAEFSQPTIGKWPENLLAEPNDSLDNHAFNQTSVKS